MSNKPYVFISYAHKDTDLVLPCINQMKKNGINIWYDEGIQAGSEWPEYIAQQVVSCTKFVLFISKAYLESQNCKRELNFAISRKKDILSVFMEDVELSPGMEMQLGTYQAVFRNRYATSAEFQDAFCKEEWFNSCRVLEVESEPVETATANQETAPAPAEPVAPPVVESTPVTEPAAPTVQVEQPKVVPKDDNYKIRPLKKRTTAALLAFLLGGIGLHRFYLDKNLSAMLYACFCWTIVPSILGIVDGVSILKEDDNVFVTKYKCRTR